MTRISFQEDDGTIVLNGDAVSVGEVVKERQSDTLGTKLLLNGAARNTDAQWLARYVEGKDRSTLRICMGDNNHGDAVEIGYQHYKDKNWHPVLTVHANGAVEIHGDLTLKGKLKGADGTDLSDMLDPNKLR